MIPDVYELIFCPPTQDEDELCETTPFISTCVSLSHLLVCGNSALNWIVYLLAGEKFRSAWCNTYLPKQCQTKRLQRNNARYPRYNTSCCTGKQYIINDFNVYIFKELHDYLFNSTLI